MNAIHVIAPYRHHGLWVFDDQKSGLAQEPFVAGADILIDDMTRNLPRAAQGFVLIFSSGEFPGYQHRFTWRGKQGSGDVYYSPDFDKEGWLCPALLRYFEQAPGELYVQVKAAPLSGS